MAKKHRSKLIFPSSTAGTIVIEEETPTDSKEPSIIQNISTSLSVSSFPTIKLELKPNAKYGGLISVKSGDRVEFHVCEIGNPYNKLFKGILSKVTVKAKKDEFELIMQGVSEFYNLQKRHVSSQSFKTRSGLREILEELIGICGIEGKITVDKNINNEFALSPFKSFPALALINSICYSKDLVYDFNEGDVMSFSKRTDVINKMQSSTPIVLDDDQIISSSFEQ